MALVFCGGLGLFLLAAGRQDMKAMNNETTVV
jgi:hypothetical protein